MSDTPTPDAIQPRAMWLRAWVISLFLGSIYSALGHWIDFIILPATLLVCGALVLPMVYGGTAPRFLVRLLIACVGAVLGTCALWGVWYGLEFSWAALAEVTKMSPQQMLDRIIALSDQYTYSVETEYGTNDHGTGFTKVIWATETAVFVASPILGAIIGPRGLQRFRQYAAAYDAKRAQR